MAPPSCSMPWTHACVPREPPADLGPEENHVKIKPTRPTFGDRIVVVAEGQHGVSIRWYGYMLGEGYGRPSNERRNATTACYEGEMEDWHNIRENPKYCIAAVPSYDSSTGCLDWNRVSVLCSRVLFDCTSIRMVDEHTRNTKKGAEWARALRSIESNLSEKLADSIVRKFFAMSRWENLPDQETLAGLLVAAGIVPAIDPDAELARLVRAELAVFNAQKEEEQPQDF